jgi:syringomycin synthetase protein SyrE
MEESSFTTQLNYWQNHFSDPIASLQLPTDYPSTSLSSYEGKCQHLVCSPKLTKSLKSLSYQQGVSLFATLLAAFKVLLYGYIRQENLLVCTPVAGRHGTETKNLIGYFNNMVMLKTDLSDNLSFTELVTQVGQVASDAYAHQNVPLQKLAELPQLAKTSLTKAMFVLQNIPHPSFEWEGLKITSEYVERPIANFDLSMSMEEKEGQLTGALQYKSALFEDVTISQMGENFQSLLQRIVANPEQPISSLASLIETRESSVQKKTQKINHKQQETYIAPRNEIEVKLTKIWENVLDIQPIGVKDNLFTLGVDSLGAVRLWEQIQLSLPNNLALTTIFQFPTIEQLYFRWS